MEEGSWLRWGADAIVLQGFQPVDWEDPQCL